MSFSPDSRLTMKALEMAWETRGKPGGVMFHSDQGSHYTSRQFRQLLWRYRNVFIQDDPGMHFRRVIRNAEGQRRWRCRNSEPDAGKVLNTRLASDGLLRQ